MSFSLFLRFLALTATASAVSLDAATFANTTFDFIVAGGGTAGVAVAVRLSEVANVSVGIIEAGSWDPNDERILIPQGTDTAGLQSNADYSWNFYTVPQEKLDDRSIFMSRGKVLGGSSAINLMGIALAGAVEYDQIGQLGNPGWSYNTSLKYFKKATNMSVAPVALQQEEHATFSPEFHGDSGPVKASFSAWESDAIPPFYDAMVNLGFAPVEDDGDGLDAGSVWSPPLAIDQSNETRSYSANAYYLPNVNQSNLYLLTGAQVIKVNLSSTPDSTGNYTATGVTYVADGVTYTASVRQEVILSAGSIQSPQLLELSGMGNKTILENYGIESIIDLPTVGENYQDHLITTSSFEIPNTTETWDVFNNPAENATVFAEYEANRTGPYASSIDVVAFTSATNLTSNQTLLSSWLESIDTQFNASNPSAGRRAVYELERQRLIWNDPSASLEVYCAPSLSYSQFFEPNSSYIQIATIQSHPFSRGSVHINTSDPLSAPTIDLNAWAFDIDKFIHIQGAKFARNISQTAPFLNEIQSYVYPGLNITTDDEYEAFIASTIGIPFHPTVSFAGHVYRAVLQNLATHLMGTTYAIAEQAADIIKAAHNYPITL